jgi:hypothetical protein
LELSPNWYNRGMRFSLKDLLWSITFASLGLACLSFWLNAASWNSYVDSQWFIPLYQLINILTGAFFGAAIGRLFRRMLVFTFAGAILSLAVSVVHLFVMAIKGMV